MHRNPFLNEYFKKERRGNTNVQRTSKFKCWAFPLPVSVTQTVDDSTYWVKSVPSPSGCITLALGRVDTTQKFYGIHLEKNIECKFKQKIRKFAECKFSKLKVGCLYFFSTSDNLACANRRRPPWAIQSQAVGVAPVSTKFQKLVLGLWRRGQPGVLWTEDSNPCSLGPGDACSQWAGASGAGSERGYWCTRMFRCRINQLSSTADRG